MDSPDLAHLKQYSKTMTELNDAFALGQDCDAAFNLGYIAALYNHNLITLEERRILEKECVKFLHE